MAVRLAMQQTILVFMDRVVLVGAEVDAKQEVYKIINSSSF